MGSEDSPTTTLPPSDISQINTTIKTTEATAIPTTSRTLEDELQTLRDSEAQVKQQLIDSQRRERILVRRLAIKEQEMQDYIIQITELKAAQTPSHQQLRNALLDPAVNILIQKLKAELLSTRTRLEDTKKELEALKFTPDSTTGKRLMAKCRQLYQENEDLGRMTSNGRLAKLESDLALQKNYSEYVKKSQLELENDLQMLDEDVEGMQTTIIILQQELKAAKDAVVELEKENQSLKQTAPVSTGGAEAVPADATSNSSTTSTDKEFDDQKIVFNGKDVKIEKIDNDSDESLMQTNTENNGDLINRTSNNNKISVNNHTNGGVMGSGDTSGDEDVATNNKRKIDSTLDVSDDGVSNENSNQIIVINHKKLRRSSPIQKTITSEDENLISNNKTPTNGK